MSMSSKNIVTPWNFRDGRDYVVSLLVAENSSSVTIKVCDGITAEEWSGSFDSKYIENLTQRTGSYKPFDIFISMIKGAILKKSDSVALEMMNLEDLELLRSKKCDITTRPSDLTLLSTFANSTERTNANVPDQSNKRYLIVTYIAEFDKVHYPMPLNYSGPPDPQVMQTNIKNLRSENSALRNAKIALEEEVILLKKAQSKFGSSSDVTVPKRDASVGGEVGLETVFHHKQFGQSFEVDSTTVRQLNLKIRILEQKLGDSQEETEDQKTLNEKLRNERDYLQEKLKSAEKYEEELENEIYALSKSRSKEGGALQRERAEPVGDAEGKNTDESSLNGRSQSKRRRERNSRQDVRALSPSRTRRRVLSGELPWGKGATTDDSEGFKNPGCIHTSSPSPARLRRRNPTPFRQRSRSNSPSPSARPKFDPTDYVNKKKIKQQQLAALRLEKARSQHESSGSSREGSRSRNNSQTRLANTLGLCPHCNMRNCRCRHKEQREFASRYSASLRKPSQSPTKITAERCGISMSNLRGTSSGEQILRDIDRAGRLDACRTKSVNRTRDRYQNPSRKVLSRSPAPANFRSQRSQEHVSISSDKYGLAERERNSSTQIGTDDTSVLGQILQDFGQ